MTLYAAPFVSELSAAHSLSNISAADIVVLYSLPTNAEHVSIIAKIAECVHQAANIYMLRVTNTSGEIIKDRVQYFIDAASLFNATFFGGHVLIWPFFIVGAECSDIRHREFIVAQLQCLWEYTGFANTLYAIRLLHRIWENQSGDISGWTKILVKHAEGFVM